MKNGIMTGIALATLCLGLTSHQTFAAGAGIDVLIGNTGDDRLIGCYDAELGVLLVAGTDQDDAIEISATRDGAILVNKGGVRIEGGIPTLKNTRLILLDGGAGDDLLVARRMPLVAIRGGQGRDHLVWDNSDAAFERGMIGEDLLFWNETKDPIVLEALEQTTVIGGLTMTEDGIALGGDDFGGWGNDWIVGGTGRD